MALYVDGSTPSTPDHEDLVDGLSALSRTLVGITARTLAALDAEVTLSQYRTLVVLASHSPIRTVDLAARLGVHPSTATRTCDRLVRRELVARHHRPVDRRVAWLTLTEAGKTLVGDVLRRRTDEIRRLLLLADGSRPHTPAELIEALVIAAGEPTEEQWWRRWERCTARP
ncbi:MarR family winged helix-turn-helix transcriptional regulator [Micromonospora halophytica]|uniref:DNA-binding transcriptional regulator, MarR family n=1 Tax=Micromonospora halophytica TaxID=47864 RepID=A0A1C5I7I4_9ACTN|nr:MarR family transcriptional regulator [Micromonospora halophytica]SCG54157.1 DNA-binding transcriptional regulator, MarR family [Micromonospora halophytica]